MAARIRLSSLAIGLLVVLPAIPVAAQTPAQPPAGSAARSQAGADADERKPAPGRTAPKITVRPEDCKKLPGGNAPINRLARLDGGISVRNLDLTYLGKPLFEFTDYDYEYLEALWPECSTFAAETAPKVARRLKELVEDAKTVRRDSLEWIKQTERDAKALKPGHAGIEKIHDMWQQMLNREFEMLESDMSYIGDVLSKRRDELYTAPQPQQRTLVSPFDPGPPDVRTLGGRGG